MLGVSEKKPRKPVQGLRGISGNEGSTDVHTTNSAPTNPGRSLMGYTYKGTVNTPAPVKRLTFDPSKCGSRAGYRQHQNHGIYICTACRAANTAYMNAYNASKRVAA